MKKKMEQLKLWIQTHKKKVAACMVVILLALGALGIGLAGMQKENQKEVIAKTDQKKKIDKKQTKKTDLKEEKTSKDDSKKKETETKETAKEKTEVKTEEKQTASQPDASASTQKNDAPQTTGGSNGGNSGNGGTQNTAPAHTHNYNIPLYTQQWVVDQAAWTETVNEPVYEMVELSICNGCGMNITGDPWGHIDAQLDAGIYTCGGFHSEWVQKQTGTNTHTVNHPEQGHYESIVTGYQCSCGAVE